MEISVTPPVPAKVTVEFEKSELLTVIDALDYYESIDAGEMHRQLFEVYKGIR